MRSRRRLVVGILSALAFVNVAVYGAYSLPRSMEERAIATHTAVLKQELLREQQVVAELKERVEAIEANKKDVRRFYEHRVEEREASLVPILRHIETLATEQGLRVGEQKYTPKDVKSTPLERFEINMPVAGTYRQLVQLMARFEESPYFLTLDEVKVRSGTDAGQAQLDLVLSCYFGKGSKKSRE
ncbi:MAG TPA: type 4a pilus biogenesis protein PilO [Vicinamibacteria bacterium]|nr:type 4a pilus biogenesis protein PilO [Vicinamibacteria bacterium]